MEFLDTSGRQLQETPVTSADFAQAIEAAFFDGLRKGAFTEYRVPLSEARVEPHFPRDGERSPRTRGFSVVLPTPDAGEHRVDFGVRFFQSRAIRTIGDLMRQGTVPLKGQVNFRLNAYLDGEAPKAVSGARFTLEDAAIEVPLRPGSRRALGTTEAWDSPRADDFPVLISRRVLEEAVEEARRAPERETGGVLLGHLRRDPETGEVFLEVTCQVPAEETQATGTSITFTPATWARVREVIDFRGEGEIFAGWVHSHPFRLCADCPLKPPPECIQKVLFYSSDDEFLMELSFGQPFMIGLLTAVEPKLEAALGHLPVRLYGWKRGAIQARGFEVISDNP
jgi:proteasome lid subunit RPN8/RPN11